MFFFSFFLLYLFPFVSLEIVDIYKSHEFQLGNNGSNLTEEELETHSISAWKEGKLHLSRQIDGNGRAHPKHLVHVSCLKDSFPS